MTIQGIIKKAVQRLELEGKLLTPDFYAEAFCTELSKAGMNIEDCSHVEKFKDTLNKEFQKEITQYRVKTMSELARFLISKLNRTNSSHCANLLESETIFIKRVLQVVEVLHNKEASDLARKSIDLLNNEASATQIDQFRQLWVNFITTYDDTFLEKLKSLGQIDNTDLKKSIESLNIISSDKLVAPMELSSIASLLVASLVPSIASSVNEKIASISQKIKKNPSLLESVSVEAEIKSAISLRIALDKQSVRDMITSLDGVLDKLSLRLIDMIERSDSSTVEIQKIKVELEEYNEDPITNFKIAHKKLFTIAVALEENTQALSKDLKNHNGEVKALSNKIVLLEEELKKTREESKEDFLTKLSNRRALDELISIKESEFERYNHNFSIVMFDLDYFKAVNDNYGHDAGDAVLSAFAKILKAEARNVDIIGRFGGEEFMALLEETNAEGGAIFAEKVRVKVEKARFMYKGERIEVTVSCGVSERSKHPSIDTLIKSADENLYKAKKDGRNRVVH
ncbi:GGDEF domain-containing protein [Candidatus Sulfurimonas baltica]|uniref:diguanylate cyclase n=1 Tax=Candidatus Sulfurimonas baltica TaxID=2740404 RepID=A0A7S7LW83_9BACT|nr:GGDEF domain-containing protein [Candidatus Sulfurimonas baltica]QOY52550.1 diguanylate cyclase [Candidatus Sulfurimonas baltica]